MKRIYRNPEALIRAAIGGRLAYSENYPVLHLSERNSYDQIANTYLTPDEAAERAGLDYCPVTQ